MGGFATRPIPAGTRLIEYAGERLTPAEAEARYPDATGERHHTFLFAIDDEVVVDAAVNGNEARFLNHSCAPNCDAVIDDGRIWIEAIHDIEVGEELVYDYAYVLENGTHRPRRRLSPPRRRHLPRHHSRQEAITRAIAPPYQITPRAPSHSHAAHRAQPEPVCAGLGEAVFS